VGCFFGEKEAQNDVPYRAARFVSETALDRNYDNGRFGNDDESYTSVGGAHVYVSVDRRQPKGWQGVPL